MSVNWLVCVLTCGIVLYSKQVTGTPVGLNRRSRYVEVDKAEFDCTGKGSGYFVHPTSCSAYYACVNGKAFKSECLPGLLYHQTTTFCEKAELVDCSRSTMATGTMTQTTDMSTSGQSTSSMMQSTMTSMPPTTQQSTTMMPTTQSVPMTTTVTTTTTKPTTMMMSTTQMMTTSTMSTMMSTMTTTLAPPTTTVMTTTPPTTTVMTTTPPTTTMKTTTTQAPAATTQSSKDVCSNQQIGKLVRNPDDCNSYYECLSDGPLLLHCGPTTVFNEKYGVCDYKYHVPGCK